jgi:chemotaxis protein methyltransferase WspC
MSLAAAHAEHHLHADHPAIARFIDLLHETIGLDAESIGAGTVARAVRERFAAWRGRGTATLEDYWLAVGGDRARLQDLIEAVVVPETWFFRDPEAFAALVRLARARLAERPERPVRVLSMPCSSGEEAYSAAMAFIDAGIAPERFSIRAIDVSERSLAIARRAHYGRNAFRGQALAFRERHFTHAADGWQLNEAVAKTVRFTQANLMHLDCQTLGQFDFIFCRNLLIYFDRDTQRAALDVLDALLAEDGTLFVGPGETGLLMREGMRSANIALAFAFHRPETRDAGLAARSLWAAACAHAPARPAPASLMPAGRFDARPAPALTPESLASRAAFADAAWHAPHAAGDGAGLVASPAIGLALATAENLLKGLSMPASPPAVPHATPARVLPEAAFDTSIRHAPASAAPAAPKPGDAHATPTLATARSLADQGRLDAAQAAVRSYLKEDASSAEAHYLLGVIADARGEKAESRQCYRRAIYLDPAHREALTHLAALLALDGDEAGARLLIARAERASNDGGRHG